MKRHRTRRTSVKLQATSLMTMTTGLEDISREDETWQGHLVVHGLADSRQGHLVVHGLADSRRGHLVRLLSEPPVVWPVLTAGMEDRYA